MPEAWAPICTIQVPSRGAPSSDLLDRLFAPFAAPPAGGSQSARSHRSVTARRSKTLQETDETMEAGPPSRPTERSSTQQATVSGNSSSRILHGPIARCSMPSVRCRHRGTGQSSGSVAFAATIRYLVPASYLCNRHCPKCLGNARAKWLTARSCYGNCCPIPYFHVVFTLLPGIFFRSGPPEQAAAGDLFLHAISERCLELQLAVETFLGADVEFSVILRPGARQLTQSPYPLPWCRRRQSYRRLQDGSFLAPLLPACSRSKGESLWQFVAGLNQLFAR